MRPDVLAALLVLALSACAPPCDEKSALPWLQCPKGK